MKLEIKHLAPYLPYGLRMQVLKNYCNGGGFWTLAGNETEMESKYIESQMTHCKPILRPLSDLTKEIEANGKVFIPLLEMFYLIDSVDYIGYFGSFNDPKFQIDDGWNHCLSFCGEDNELCFSFSGTSFWLMVDDEVELLNNQIGLINKLIEYHFDIYGLIEAGLAIDINTITNG